MAFIYQFDLLQDWCNCYLKKQFAFALIHQINLIFVNYFSQIVSVKLNYISDLNKSIFFVTTQITFFSPDIFVNTVAFFPLTIYFYWALCCFRKCQWTLNTKLVLSCFAPDPLAGLVEAMALNLSLNPSLQLMGVRRPLYCHSAHSSEEQTGGIK